MKRAIIVLILLLLCGVSSLFIYSKAESTVTTMQVIDRAIKQKDTPALIKELVERIKNEIEIDEARYPVLIREVEQYALSCDRPEEAAILHSLVAEMYASFEEYNAWRINRRTPVVGYVPEDINEWTSNLFKEKISREYALSLQPEELLQQIPITRYAALIEKGKNESLRPSLYDYLIYRVLEVEPTDELYQKLIAYKQKAGNLEALMLAELDYAAFRHQATAYSPDRTAYRASLDSLYSVYSEHDFAAEIWVSRLGVMENMSYRVKQEEAALLNKEIIELCKRAVTAHPSYRRINIFKNKLGVMQNPELNVTMPTVVYPDEEFEIGLKYRNVKKMVVKVYQTSLMPEVVSTNGYWSVDEQKRKKTKGKLIRQIQVSLDIPNTYQSVDTLIRLGGLNAYGIYEYEINVPETTLNSSHFVFVSRTTAMSRSLKTGGAEVLVSDLKTGKPKDKVQVLLYKNTSGQALLVDSVLTDLDGIAKIGQNKEIRYFRTINREDRFTPLATIYPGQRFGGDQLTQKENTQVALFTDRGLYRPGQRVYFKGIAYTGEKDQQRVLPNRSFRVSLRDANHKEVAVRELTSNEFGSFNGEFTLPSQGLNGHFTLSTENTTVAIRVEEYKRPSFIVEFNPIKSEIAFGDTVKIEGKAQTYSGVALQNGKVNYRVLLRPFRFAYSGMYMPAESQLLSGETSLDETGSFAFDFVAKKQSGMTSFPELPVYESYEVIATITDSKGETQEMNYYFSVGSSSIVLSTNLSPQMKNHDLSVQVNARTLNGEPVKAEGSYTIWNLKQEVKNGQKTIEQKLGELVDEGRFSTDRPIPATALAKLPSGSYRIKLEAVDSRNRPVLFTQDVILYTDKDKRPPVFSDIWMVENNLSACPGEDVSFVFGTSHRKAYVLYELIADGAVVSRKRIELSDENRKLTVPFLPEYGDAVVALFSFVKDGRLYTQQLRINKKKPDKSLTIKTETFRDRLQPGNKESWTLRVLKPDSLPAAEAEILASMYDASLDAISPFNWAFSIWDAIYVNVPVFRANSSYGTSNKFLSGQVNYKDVPVFDYSRFNWRDAMLILRAYATRHPAPLSMLKNRDQSLESVAGVVIEEAAVELQDAAGSQDVLSQSGRDSNASDGGNRETSPRRNFDETAFFYPVLRTDKDGAVVINFTLPESNTTWKFQTLAHTKEMYYGQLTEEVVSSKPLMVLPNLPRFVRRGDVVKFSAQVINRSDEEIAGRVRLELFDPETEEIIVCLTKSQFPFELAAGKQTTVAWTVPVPATKNLLGVRIIADSEMVSDGEQHLLPVLSDEVLITESKPIYLKGEGEKKIAVSEKKPMSYRPYLQTLEISANPIWYAVQALPTLTQPVNNSASAWFAAYYSNTLASFIVKSNPQIRTIMDQWTALGKDAASLLSNLEKNAELKQVLLEETPWVLEAESETEQIRRLNTLFDLNRAESQRTEALRELIRLQREDGAWGWFGGFAPDSYVTTAILQGMSDLVRLNAIEYGQEEKEMQLKALTFLDKRIADEFAQLKKRNLNWKQTTPTEWQLDYVLMRSSYRDIPEAKETREAIRFYTDRAEAIWDKLPVRMRVQTALVLHKNGKKEKAQTILSWFKRTATQTEEQGLYWANNRRMGFSPVSPVETHTLLMTAFTAIPVDGMDVDKMKQWLLNQKRTQYWETTPATLNAIYALLLTGDDWLDENNRVLVDWNNQTIDTQSGSVGIGYSKTVQKPVEGKTSDEIILRKTGDAPAWGALYNQYFVPMEEVETHLGDLSVEKMLFVEKAGEKGRQLVALKAGETLRVGDKAVVRLTIRTKQEMTYVHLKDTRAGCFEPAEQLSGAQYRDGVFYYRTGKDASEQFFFDRLPEGTFVLEYAVYVSRSGEYAAGPATIQCLYAPEYTAHTAGQRLIIKD